MKWAVARVRKRKAGSNADAAWTPGAAARITSALADSRMIRGRTEDIFEEQQICRRPEVNAGQRALGDGVVGLVPQADVRDLFRQDLLNLAEEPHPLGQVGRCGRLLDQ